MNENAVKRIIKREYATTADEKKNYARRVGILSRETGLDFSLCLAIGDDPDIYRKLIDTYNSTKEIKEEDYKNLNSEDIIKQKRALKGILGKKLYQQMNIPKVGKEHCKRIAKFFVEEFE